MSKFKKRAEKILIEHYGCKDKEDLNRCFLANVESYTMIVEAMCQAMEEVEEKQLKWLKEIYKTDKVYTKEQVEELLAKQRELCYQQGLTTIYETIDKDSILNAKLNIDELIHLK